MFGLLFLGRVPEPERLVERVVVKPAFDDLAERLHRRVRMTRQIRRQIELELVVDHARVAQEVVHARDHDIDDFCALCLHRIE